MLSYMQRKCKNKLPVVRFFVFYLRDLWRLFKCPSCVNVDANWLRHLIRCDCDIAQGYHWLIAHFSCRPYAGLSSNHRRLDKCGEIKI